MANAGVDQSNVATSGRRAARAAVAGESGRAARRRCASGLAAVTGIDLAVVINDSFGRAWRQGTAGVAIGAAGLPALIDLRGRPDLFGRTLEVSVIGFADEIAAAASLADGPGGRGAAGRPDAGLALVGARIAAAASFVPRVRICFDESGSRGRAVRRHRRRQARAGPEPDRQARGSASSSPMSAMISSISACISRPTSTR